MRYGAMAAGTDLQVLRQESLEVVVVSVTLAACGWVGFLFFTTGNFTADWWAPLPLVLGLALGYIWRQAPPGHAIPSLRMTRALKAPSSRVLPAPFSPQPGVFQPQATLHFSYHTNPSTHPAAGPGRRAS